MTRLAGERILDLDLQQPLTWCDRAIEWVLALTLLFAPAAFGANEAWSQQIFFAAVAVLAGLTTVKLLTDRQSELVWTWAYVPIVLYLAIVALSIIPLSAGVLNVISPGTVAEKRALLADLPNVDQLTASSTISFDVWSTERGLRLVAAMSVLFVVTVNTFRTPQRIKRLLALIVAAGTAVTLLTLAQDLTADPTKPPMIYWTFTWYSPPHPNSGPFIGHAQLGQYLNLTLGATIALALVMVGETFAGEDLSLGEARERLNDPRLAVVYALVVAMVAMAVANGLAASRGAMIGLAGAGLFTTVLILLKRGWRAGETPIAIGAVVAVMALLGALVWFVVLPKLEQKHSTASSSLNDRTKILKSVPAMVAKWPVMGTGLESFEWVYPNFQDRETAGRGLYDHAENEYAQTLTDTGIVGGAITLAFLLIIGANWRKAYRGTMPIHLASIGIAFALVAVMIHSFADFAQRTTAIGMISALMCGMLVSLARLSRPQASPEGSAPRFAFSPVPRLVVGVAMLAAMGWALWSNHAVYMGEKYYYVSDYTWTGDLNPADADYDAKLVAFYDERIQGCQQALEYDPKALYYIRYLNEFRWRKLARQRDPMTDLPVYPADAAEHGKQIVKELSDARALCPTYGPLYVLQGKVLYELNLDKEQGRKLLHRGYDLLPTDPEVNFALAEIAAADGKWDEAVEWARACFRLHRGYDARIRNLFVVRYPQIERGVDVFAGDAYGLQMMLHLVPREDIRLRERINGESIDLLIKQTQSKAADGPAFARLAEQLEIAKRNTEAVEAMDKALNLDYGNVAWRLRRARLLRDLGRGDDAINDVQFVLNLTPNNAEARALLDELNKLRRKDGR